MIRRFIKTNIVPALLASIAIMMLIPFAESVHRVYDKSFPAIEWNYGKAINLNVKPGEVLHILYNAKINKSCPSEIRGFIKAKDGTVPIRFPVLQGGYTSPTNYATDIPVSIRIPTNSDEVLEPLKSGEYVYKVIVTRFCDNYVEYDTEVPDVHFNLEVK